MGKPIELKSLFDQVLGKPPLCAGKTSAKSVKNLRKQKFVKNFLNLFKENLKFGNWHLC